MDPKGFSKGEKEEKMLVIKKDCEVEVSYDKDGFKGAWYRAIIEESPKKSQHKLLRLRVRYTTLLKEDGSSPLTEIVDQSLIRPVPPEDMNDDSLFEEGSMVNADYKDGWWIGLVVKRKEDGTYLISFDSPPDINQFERKQLRAHFDWTGSKWVRPKNKELSKSVFSPGTMVEIVERRRCFDWFPAMIIKEIENGNKFIFKYCNRKSRIKVVDSRLVRPRPPLCSVEEYDLLDHVEAFDGSVWRKGVVRGIIFKGRYMVSFGKTKVASAQFSYSDLRPPMEWKDGIWHKGPKAKSKFVDKCYIRKRKRGEAEHISDLNETGMIASFSGLVEKLKDLDTNVTVSQLDSFKCSFANLEKHGFDVRRPLLRIDKLLALKDIQLNILEKRKGLDKKKLDESSKMRKAELEFGEMEHKLFKVKHKILELKRQEAALEEHMEAAEEQKNEAYRNILHMESCATDLGVELEDVEFDFETMLSAPLES